MISPPLIRGVLSMLGLALFNYMAVGVEDVRSMIEIFGYIAAMIGVAAVMRYRVNDNEKKFDKHIAQQEKWEQEHTAAVDRWRSEHNSLHQKNSDILRSLETLVSEHQRRLQWLEDHGYERRGKASG